MDNIRKRLLSDENIFLSIYLVESYVQNTELLNKEDRHLLESVKDIFDITLVEDTIEKVKNVLEKIIDFDEEYFDIDVYFKPKKYDNGPIFRPLHTASLINQIAMVAMLQILIYDIDNSGKLVPSEISRLIPSNFYGNRVSFDGKKLFKSWQDQYQDYTGKANELLYNYCETLEYSYEVSLDLKDFFPSINPSLLYTYICTKLPLKLSEEELSTIKVIIKKLLFFKLNKLTELEMLWYVGKEQDDFSEAIREQCLFAKGIPQGLPHTYFIANIYMLIIKDIYEKELPGEMLFYVDDSVIFTNGKNGILNDDIFTDTIKNLNKNIKKQEKQLLDNTENSLKIKLPEGYSYSNNNFGVEVHNDDKSIYSEINIAKENSGERYLHGLCRETSNIGFDIYTAYSDEEIHMLNSRTHAILELVNTELARITQMQDATNEKSEKNKQYIKKLLRYKKFFAYRKTILEYKDNGTIKQLKKTIIEDITLRCTEKVEDLEYFFAKYTDDILAVLIEFVFKRCSEENVDVEDLIDAVNKLNDLLYSGNTNHSYLAKAYDKYLNKNIEYYENDTYKSIGRAMVARYKAVREQSQNNKYKRFQLDITSFCTNDYERLYEYLNFTRVFEYSYYVRSNSNELERMLLNSMFSYIFEYELDDRFNLSKRSRNPIEYSEIRILALLRNKNFDIKNFILQYDSYVSDEYRQTADYSLLQVLDVFRTFVSHPKRIDDLILIHKYCCDTWKNGSKYLHFYTLHNQEHAVSLIRSSIKVIHAISCFTLKRIDYFILFAACYLHDISMVTIPDISKFYMGNHEKADCIYTDFINEIDLNDIVKVKRRLCNAYQEIDEYFESEIRGKHAYESAREIRCHKELDFIEPSMREIIAQVSEGHGYDTTDIYFLKSTGKESLINKKIIMIILRLSDLLDMSRYRISNVVLNHNLKNLNDTSRFHWISHLITDGYELNNTHKINNQLEGKSFLQNKTITEKLVLTIDVLMCQTTEVTNKNKCKYVLNSELNSEKIDESEESEISISVMCDKNSTCINDKCTFLCKWFMVKNNYLFKEFGELNHYLNNIQDNFYSSEIEIRIKVISNNNLPNDIFDYLREYIDQ